MCQTVLFSFVIFTKIGINFNFSLSIYLANVRHEIDQRSHKSLRAQGEKANSCFFCASVKVNN